MKLQAKVSVSIAIALLASGAFVTGVFNRVVLNQFIELEDLQAKRNTDRAIESVKSELRLLSSLAKDWGMWDDAYQFINDRAPQFIDSNLSTSALDAINVSHLAFLDDKLAPIFTATSSDYSAEANKIPEEIQQKLSSSREVRAAIGFNPDKSTPADLEGLAGFVRVADKDYIFAASPISDSAGKKPPIGALWVLREISPPLIKQRSTLLNIDLSLYKISDTNTPTSRPPEKDTQQADFSSPAFSKTPDYVLGIIETRDIFGAPFQKMQVAMVREVYKKGLEVQNFLTTVLVFITALTAIVVINLIRYLITAPVARLCSSLINICQSSDFSSRVNVVGSDEISDLSSQINDTLDALQHAILAAESSQHQAEAANLAKSAFIAKVSHELRTPIHSITGMLRILLKEERSSAKRNYILMARNAAYGLLETINEILDFSKTEADKLTLEKIEFSIHDVIRDAVQTVGPRVEEKGSLEVLVSVPQALPDTVIGDPLRIKQVLVNLLGNATKFTKQGEIGVYVTPVTNENNLLELEIAISDTGIGIPTDRLEHIFEPFSQADESVSRMFTGTGLGLTLVKQFIEAMDGTVRVESELGVGSRFILNLPFQVPTKAKPVVYRPKLGCNRIVLIDGSSASVALCLKELQDNGYAASLIASDNSEELLRLTRELTSEEQPHSTPPYGLVIVTSEALKRSRVFDLVVELRNNSAVPVVSILSPFEISVRERLLALNVPFVVTRPISLLDILGVISGELELSQEGWEDCEERSLNTSRTLEILVADDAQTNRIILTELLREAGHRVVCVENGVELVSQIKDSLEGAKGSQSFDIILTDVQMPLLDGLNATAQIRSLERKHGVIKHLPIIAVTAHAMTDETSRMRNFGIDDVVTKPLDPLRLGEVLQKLTGQKIASDIRAGSNGEAETQRAATNRKAPLSEREFCDLALRLWTQMAKRDSDLRETFSLEDDPLDPKVFKGVLDINDVYERSGDSVRRTLLIFSGFGDCFREQLQRLSDGKQSRDLNDIRFGAHALKGLLLDVGAKASADLACRIEQLALKGEADKAVALISQLTKQVLLISRLVAQITNSAGEGASGDGNTRASRDSGAQKYEVREQ